MEREGRAPELTLLSARDLSCSDQLKAGSGRAAEENRSEGVLDSVALLALESLLLQVGATPEAGLAVVVGVVVVAAVIAPVGEWGVPRKVLLRRSGGDGLPLDPGLLPPGPRRLRMACAAPKLMRRLKGVLGAVREEEDGSSSSTAFSSMKSELLVEMLPRRAFDWAELVGEVPARPNVEMERRRRWSFMAAVVMGPGKAGVPPEFEFLLWKKLAKAVEGIEPRRWEGVSVGLLGLSLDIVEEKREVKEVKAGRIGFAERTRS